MDANDALHICIQKILSKTNSLYIVFSWILRRTNGEYKHQNVIFIGKLLTCLFVIQNENMCGVNSFSLMFSWDCDEFQFSPQYYNDIKYLHQAVHLFVNVYYYFYLCSSFIFVQSPPCQVTTYIIYTNLAGLFFVHFLLMNRSKWSCSFYCRLHVLMNNEHENSNLPV